MENRTERVLLQVFNHQSLNQMYLFVESELVHLTSLSQARFPSSTYIQYVLCNLFTLDVSLVMFPLVEISLSMSLDVVFPSCLS